MGKRKRSTGSGKGKRKYTTEICLSIVTSNSVVFRPSVLHHLGRANPEARETIQEASIYFICSRPRILIVPTSFERQDTDLHFQYIIDTGEERLVCDSVAPRLFLPNNGVSSVRISDSMSFYVELLDENLGNMGYLPVDVLVSPSSYPDESFAHYEVLYVGQSRVGKATGDISKRLVSHGTLQRILADTHANAPHKDIFVMCFKLEGPRFFSLVDPYVDAEASDDLDTRHFVEVHMTPPTATQVTSIAEACYIRHFQPAYNKLLKHSVPSPELRLLKVCYQLDLNAVLTEINTEDIGAKIYSQTATPANHHMIPFEIHPPDARRPFFTLSQADGSQLEMFPTEH